MVKELPRIQTGGNMSHPIRIGGAISIDNEFTRSYISSMKDFHETFVPLPKHSIIQQQFLPYSYVSSIGQTIIPQLSLNKSENVNKKRKTRKRNNKN